MNLAHTLERIARMDPRRPALFEGARLHRDYGVFARRCASFGTGLRAQGLAPGDRIAIFMRNHPAYLEIVYGAWWAGLAVVPMNAKLHPREAQWIVEHSQASRVFVTRDVAEGLECGVPTIDVDSPDFEACHADGPHTDNVPYNSACHADDASHNGTRHADEAPPHQACHADESRHPASSPDSYAMPIEPRRPDDLAWLFYTSGTTGKPKGVMITHRNLMTMGLTYFVDVDTVAPTDAIVYAGPMSHGAGLYAIPHVMAGARHVVPASGGFDAAELFELSQSVGPLSMFAAPTIVRRLVAHAQATGAPCDGFKTIVYGGAPMYVADIEHAMNVMGPRFVQIYGQGESPMTITALSRSHLMHRTHPKYAQRVGSVGVAQTPVEVRIASAEGKPLPARETGEVLVRGDTVMAGYWRDEDATRHAIRDGWLFTGDMGALDEDGFLTLKDRSKDLIISGGSNIYPREVEEVLLLAPGVAEVSVVGAPDPEWGEIVVAFVVPQAGASVRADALDAHCLQHIGRFKRPKQYRIVEALPKNNYGKVLKTQLRERLKSEAG